VARLAQAASCWSGHERSSKRCPAVRPPSFWPAGAAGREDSDGSAAAGRSAPREVGARISVGFERLDGRGWPSHAKGDEIPVAVRGVRTCAKREHAADGGPSAAAALVGRRAGASTTPGSRSGSALAPRNRLRPGADPPARKRLHTGRLVTGDHTRADRRRAATRDRRGVWAMTQTTSPAAEAPRLGCVISPPSCVKTPTVEDPRLPA
jgi:hypothetical protein